MRPNMLEDERIGPLVSQLTDDAKAYAAAEADFYKTLVSSRLDDAKLGLVMGVLALLLAHAALIALVVGALMSLGWALGPVGATAVVVIVTLAVAGLLGWLAAKAFTKVFAPLP